MALKFNGNTVYHLKYNGNIIRKLKFNGTTVLDDYAIWHVVDADVRADVYANGYIKIYDTCSGNNSDINTIESVHVRIDGSTNVEYNLTLYEKGITVSNIHTSGSPSGSITRNHAQLEIWVRYT